MCSPEEGERRGQAGNEREMDRVRASGTNLREDHKQEMTTEADSGKLNVILRTDHPSKSHQFCFFSLNSLKIWYSKVFLVTHW